MKIIQTYSHLNGLEYLLVHKKGLWNEAQRVIQSVDGQTCETKVSKEKLIPGTILYSPKGMNKAFSELLTAKGWSESHAGHWGGNGQRLLRQSFSNSADEHKAEVVAAREKPIFTSGQTDFVKERVAIEVQFGKYLCIAYDLFVKPLAFYVRDQIDVGIEILAMMPRQSGNPSCVGYYEGALHNIVRKSRGFPAVPLVLVGVEP